MVDVLVHEHALGKLPKTAAQFCNPARPTTFIVGPGCHRRWEIMLLPEEDPRVMEQPPRVWKVTVAVDHTGRRDALAGSKLPLPRPGRA